VPYFITMILKWSDPPDDKVPLLRNERKKLVRSFVNNILAISSHFCKPDRFIIVKNFISMKWSRLPG
jgi:hypothetical protein